MLKEHGIDSLDADILGRLSDKKLTEPLIEGPGRVTLAEVITLSLYFANKKVPQNVANTVLNNIKGETQRWIISKSIENWNNIVDDAPMRKALKEIMIPNLAGAMALADGYDLNAIQNQDLKLQNLETAVMVVSRELGAL